MAERFLVEESIRAGELLTERLAGAKFPLVASFWLYSEESERWQLVLASSLVDQVGLKEAYRKVQAVLRANPELKPLTLNDISVVPPREGLVRDLRQTLGSASSVRGLRLGGTRVNNHIVDDAYLYRLAPLRSSSSTSRLQHAKS